MYIRYFYTWTILLLPKLDTYEYGNHKFVIVQFGCGDSISVKAWVNDHDSSQFICSLAGSSRKQQLVLQILMEYAVDTKEVDVEFNVDTPIYQTLGHMEDLFLMSWFPLHVEKHRKDLMLHAKWNLFKIDIHTKQHMASREIYQYFGPKITMYFGWLSYYTKYLIGLALLGMCLNVPIGVDGIKDLVWMSMLVLFGCILRTNWRRYQVELEFQWKYTPVTDINEQLNPTFQGEWITDPVTRQRVFDYPSRKRIFTRLFVSLPVMLGMGALVCWYVLAINNVIQYVQKNNKVCLDTYGAYYCKMLDNMPSLLNIAAIATLDYIYHVVAGYLNTLENYRTVRETENEFLLKVVPFYLINNNALLLYLALYRQDLPALHEQLWSQLVLVPVISIFTGVAWPQMQSMVSLFWFKKHHMDTTATADLQRIWMQKHQKRYDDAFDDYKDLMIQYCLVLWFSALYPMGPMYALINNIISLRSDAFKLLSTYGFQRPVVQNTKGINMWDRMVYVISLLSICINCCIFGIYYLPKMYPFVSVLHKVVVVVAMEHVLFALQLAIEGMIPRVPSWVQTQRKIQKLNLHAQHVAHIRNSDRTHVTITELFGAYAEKWHLKSPKHS